MYSSYELIDALLARGRKRLWFRDDGVETPPGEFPAGWKAWFTNMRERIGAVTGASADAIVAIFLQRELATPAPRSGDLTRWQAFSALWRQQWHAAERESARDRIAAMAITLLVHLLLGILLLWIAYVRFMGTPPPPGEDVVQVEYIGQGTPDDTGGGAPSATVQQPQAQPQAAAPAAPSTPPAPAAAAAASSAVEPQPSAAPPTPQPIQVSESSAPDAPFVLPPTTAPDVQIAMPALRTPSVQAVERSVELVEVPNTPVVRQVQVVPRVQPSTSRQPSQQVRERDIPVLETPQSAPTLAQRPSQAPRLQAQAQLIDRDVPLAASAAPVPSASPASGQAAASSQREGNVATSPASAPGGQPERSNGTRADSATAGRGANPSAAPGGVRSPVRGDDWGDSDRNRPGGNSGSSSGLFNADGSPRLPPGAAAAGGGFPPGSDNWTRDQIERYGTWSKRPLIGYDPTRFDEYWIPSGSLLEEWVRRGVRSMSIPIPGTSKKINCVLSVLQLGGGCGISDPNKQDQEAIARPPPEIPYKPELQETEGSGKP